MAMVRAHALGRPEDAGVILEHAPARVTRGAAVILAGIAADFLVRLTVLTACASPAALALVAEADAADLARTPAIRAAVEANLASAQAAVIEDAGTLER